MLTFSNFRATCVAASRSGRAAFFVVLMGLFVSTPAPAQQTSLENLLQVGVGSAHACAVSADGRVSCWGSGANGQLGNGGFQSVGTTPVGVESLSGVSKIGVALDHSCALVGADEVYCWGSNFHGELGSGDSNSSSALPRKVIGLPPAMHVVAGGAYEIPPTVFGIPPSGSGPIPAGGFSCALTLSNAVQCWGINNFGQLGDGTRVNRAQPAPVVGLGSGIASLSAGGAHACALTNAGAVFCWGANTQGQLGDGTTVSRDVPALVVGLESGVQNIALGEVHSCAQLASGALRCWGANIRGEIGDGTFERRLVPTALSVQLENVTNLAAGGYRTCAGTADGRLHCWGSNSSGELGDGTRIVRANPTMVSGLSGSASQVDMAARNTCVRNSLGRAQCWGNNFQGTLADGHQAFRRVPTETAFADTAVSSVSAALDGDHSCALDSNGNVRCWGENTYGQLGDGTTVPRSSPVFVAAGMSSVQAGATHSCALSIEGAVRCWGDNSRGQLGDGSNIQSNEPIQVVGLESGALALSVGSWHSCAVTSERSVVCWGSNSGSQLGNNSTADSNVPVSAFAPIAMASVAAGRNHSCAISTGGAVLCWGDGQFGQIGNGGFGSVSMPSSVSGLETGATEITAGANHNCAIDASGGMLCWGIASEGRLGNGSSLTNRNILTPVTGLNSGVESIDAGSYHTCARLATGTMHCWGRNFEGQAGIGSNQQLLVPNAVQGLSSQVASISAGHYHTCAVINAAAAAGTLRCWGWDQLRQLGLGGRVYSLPGDVVASEQLFRDGFE